jgi:metal-sulfur cluster biosynthetic enzyme
VQSRKDEVERILDEIVDPCSAASGVPIGLAEMGIVDKVVVDGGTVFIRLIPTFPGCVYTGVFANEIKQRLHDLDWPEEVNVELAADAIVWDEERMSAGARERLYQARIERRRHAEARKG